MAEPLRHRQTKEADNRYVPPKATAPHLDSTRSGSAGRARQCLLLGVQRTRCAHFEFFRSWTHRRHDTKGSRGRYSGRPASICPSSDDLKRRRVAGGDLPSAGRAGGSQVVNHWAPLRRRKRRAILGAPGQLPQGHRQVWVARLCAQPTSAPRGKRGGP
jgi:hypothetical protein